MASHYEEIMKTKPYPPFNMGDCLTEAIIAKAQKELGETEEVKARTIPELRRLVQAEPNLICQTDDADLLQFLRARKFNVPRAFSLLKNLFSLKSSNSDMFGSFNQEVLMRAFNHKAGMILPYRDEEGCAIVLLKMRKWDIDLTNGSEALTAFSVIFLMALQESATQICGVRVLIDVRGANLKQIRSLIPRHVILLGKALTDGVPIRFKGIHLFNESPIFQYMFSILKLFLTEKIKNRIHLHGCSQKHLHKFIPKAILPAHGYGGDNPNDVAAWFNAEMVKYYESYRQFTAYGYRR